MHPFQSFDYFVYPVSVVAPIQDLEPIVHDLDGIATLIHDATARVRVARQVIAIPTCRRGSDTFFEDRNLLRLNKRTPVLVEHVDIVRFFDHSVACSLYSRFANFY